MQRYPLHIDGTQRHPRDDRWITSDNPYTGKPWAEIARGNDNDVDEAVRAAHRAFTEGPWSSTTATDRGRVLRDIGDRIAEDADRLARIEVQDNGKLLSEMRGQVDYVPQWFYYYGGLADKIEGTVLPSTRRATSPTPGASPSGSSPSSPRGIRR